MRSRRHLVLLASRQEETVMDDWPAGTFTALLDVLPTLSFKRTMKDRAETVLRALEPKVREREKLAVGRVLDDLEAKYGDKLTPSQVNLVKWLRRNA